MLNIEQIANTMKSAFEAMKTPADMLPANILFCLTVKRPGLSAMSLASRVISKNNALGILTGKNPDGTDNVVNQFIYNFSEAIVDEIHENAVAQFALPAGNLSIQVTGGNAGGPVTCNGTNIITSAARGIIR